MCQRDPELSRHSPPLLLPCPLLTGQGFQHPLPGVPHWPQQGTLLAVQTCLVHVPHRPHSSPIPWADSSPLSLVPEPALWLRPDSTFRARYG